MLNKSILAAGIGLVLSAAAAQAVPITTPPPTLNALGNVTAVYIFADANDNSVLNEVTTTLFNPIFCNHSITGTCAGNNSGDSKNLFPPSQSGPIVFSLNNVTSGNLFTTNAVGSDGFYHALITNNYAAFGLGALPSAALAKLSTLGGSITFVGFEDKTQGQGSDFDYNDLIFAFANTAIVGVPEPLTLSLFGAGLAGAALMRRRKKVAKS